MKFYLELDQWKSKEVYNESDERTAPIIFAKMQSVKLIVRPHREAEVKKI